jgi:hypothetical protein
MTDTEDLPRGSRSIQPLTGLALPGYRHQLGAEARPNTFGRVNLVHLDESVRLHELVQQSSLKVVNDPALHSLGFVE